MLKKSANELQDVQGHGPDSIAAVLFKGKSHCPVLDVYDSAFPDGHLEHIGGEIFKSASAVAYCLGIDIPVNGPDIGVDFREKSCF